MRNWNLQNQNKKKNKIQRNQVKIGLKTKLSTSSQNGEQQKNSWGNKFKCGHSTFVAITKVKNNVNINQVGLGATTNQKK